MQYTVCGGGHSMWFVDGDGGCSPPFIDRCWALIGGGGGCGLWLLFVDSGVGPCCCRW
jgi:hypothetical protein